MNWREWPDGAEEYTDNTEHPYTPDATKCPVCHMSLRPMEIYYISPSDWYRPESTTYYTAICPHCRTKYNRDALTGTVTVSPDAETITELEERVRTLEGTLSRLISWIRTQQPQPQALRAPQKPETQQQEASDDAEEFTRRYRYLL